MLTLNELGRGVLALERHVSASQPGRTGEAVERPETPQDSVPPSPPG
jgi:hypothetical protein